MKRPTCNKCGSHDRENVKVFRINQDDQRHYYQWRCILCDIALPDGNSEPEKPKYQIAKTEVYEACMKHGISIDSIPQMLSANAKSCRVCGRPATEMHHWLPQSYGKSIAEYGETWATITDYLCSEHHRQWHEIVTPGLLHKRRINS